MDGMLCVYVFALALSASLAHASTISGQVVQFVVYAPQQSDVTHLFPGAQVDHTWNNVFIVNIWTNDPATLIPDIRHALDTNSNVIQTIIPPFALAAATQKWMEYNLVWVAMLVLLFLAGCACGGFVISKCNSIKRDMPRGDRRCRTTY